MHPLPPPPPLSLYASPPPSPTPSFLFSPCSLYLLFFPCSFSLSLLSFSLPPPPKSLSLLGTVSKKKKTWGWSTSSLQFHSKSFSLTPCFFVSFLPFLFLHLTTTVKTDLIFSLAFLSSQALKQTHVHVAVDDSTFCREILRVDKEVTLLSALREVFLRRVLRFHKAPFYLHDFTGASGETEHQWAGEDLFSFYAQFWLCHVFFFLLLHWWGFLFSPLRQSFKARRSGPVITHDQPFTALHQRHLSI